MEWHKVVSFFPFFTSLIEGLGKRLAGPGVAKRICGVRGEGDSGGPNGKDEIEEARPKV